MSYIKLYFIYILLLQDNGRNNITFKFLRYVKKYKLKILRCERKLVL